MLALWLFSKGADLSQEKVQSKILPPQTFCQNSSDSFGVQVEFSSANNISSAKIFYVISIEEMKTSASTYLEI